MVDPQKNCHYGKIKPLILSAQLVARKTEKGGNWKKLKSEKNKFSNLLRNFVVSWLGNLKNTMKNASLF